MIVATVLLHALRYDSDTHELICVSEVIIRVYGMEAS